LRRRTRGEEVDVVELARHLSAGSVGPSAGAVEALREAGDALVASAPRSAAIRYREAIAHLPEDDASAAALHARLAGALRRSGDPSDVVQACRQGLATAGEGESRARLIRYLASALADTGALQDAIEIIDAELAATGPNAVLLVTRSSLLRHLDDP